MHICSKMAAESAINSMPYQSGLEITTPRLIQHGSLDKEARQGGCHGVGQEPAPSGLVYMGTDIVHSPLGRLRKGKTTPVGVNLMRSQT